MKKRFSMLLAAVLCLTFLLPASVWAEVDSEDVPQVLRFGGSDYSLISDACHAKAYHTGTAYIFAAQSGSHYYALGDDLGAVALTLKDGVLSADSGVAEVVPEPSEYFKNFNNSLPAKIGDQYLAITELNGPLALSAENSFQWHFSGVSYDDPMAMFYGSISDTDTSVSGCITFQDGSFGSSQWGAMRQDNLYIYQKDCPHPHKEDHPAVEASCLAGGNQAYSYCPDCGSWLNTAGEYLGIDNGTIYRYSDYTFLLNPTGHHYVNGVCTHDPSHIALDYEPVTAGMDLFEDGYLYIIAAPEQENTEQASGESGNTEGGNRWKVMDYDPLDLTGHSTGCTAVMGSDGKLRIDNTNDGTRTAAEFRILDAEHDESIAEVLLRVPVGTQDNEAEWGMWAPDNGSKICWLKTDSGYMLMDFNWQPSEYFHHPEAILVREDGIAEIQILSYSVLMPHYAYGTANVYEDSVGGYQEMTCFSWDGETGEEDSAAPPANVRLFRAKVPACAVNAQIQYGAAAYSIVSDLEREAVLSIVGYDADGRMTDCTSVDVTLVEGLNQSAEDIAVPDAASYGVFLLEKGSLRPLSAKRYGPEA